MQGRARVCCLFVCLFGCCSLPCCLSTSGRTHTPSPLPQPFVESGYFLHDYFPPRYYAIAIPVVAGLTLLAVVGEDGVDRVAVFEGQFLHIFKDPLNAVVCSPFLYKLMPGDYIGPQVMDASN